MKLNYKKVIYVGLAFFLISMFWQAYDNVISKILIDKFGLNQTWSGVVMAFDNVLALFLLPLFGHISDKANAKMGRRTPFIIVGTIIAAFAFVSMSFIDNYQTTRIEDETVIIADYDSVQGKTPTIAEWQIIIDSMSTERASALTAGTISQKQYDEWEQNVRLKMQVLLDENTTSGLSEFELKDMKDFYYTYLSERAWQLTAQSPGVFIVFVVVLFISLVAMATFR
jgi:MFS family permease